MQRSALKWVTFAIFGICLHVLGEIFYIYWVRSDIYILHRAYYDSNLVKGKF